MTERASLEGRGVCVWFTGLSGSGKSTITSALTPMLEAYGRPVTVLDTVPAFRKVWCERSSERKLRSKAVVAREVVRHGGIAICVTVSARRDTREAARSIVGPQSFIEVFVDTPVEVSAARKRQRGKRPPLVKRLRARVRRILARVPFRKARGYERPLSPDLTIDTTRIPSDESATAILAVLAERGFVVPPSTVDRRPGHPSSVVHQTGTKRGSDA